MSDAGLVQEANLAVTNMLLVSRNRLLKKPVSDYIFPDDQDIYYSHRKKVFESSAPLAWEMRLVRSDNSVFWARLQVNPASGSELWITINDINRQKQAEVDLLVSRGNLKSTLDATADGILAVDANGKVLFSSKRFAELWRIPEAMFDTKNDAKLHDFVLGQLANPNAFLVEVQRLYASNESSFDEISFKDGRVFERYSFSMQQEGVTIPGRVWSFRDITGRKRAEELKEVFQQQLYQTQKLESLGVLAGGIAHDFNNILCVIMSSCSLAQMRPNMVRQLLPEIDKAAQRAADLCRQMLAYAGKSLLTMKKVNMAALVEEMIKMLKATIKQNVVIKSNISSDLPYVWGDASQIRQIVMNLIINASEAVNDERQGEIYVTLAETVVDGVLHKDHVGKIITAGDYVCMEVTDNGCGMDDETRQRVFEPFYTTKFAGRGLGMSAVLGIITARKGALLLNSQKGEGTTFKVYLPVQSSESTGADSLPNATMIPWQGIGTILLVEDEPQIVMIGKTLIQSLGFSVIEAANGQEALEIYQKNAKYITAVVTDIGMPIMDGYELVRKLKELAPELPVIISSGFGDMVVATRIKDGEVAGFLSKPYSFDELREVLKKVVK